MLFRSLEMFTVTDDVDEAVATVVAATPAVDAERPE